MAHRWTFAIWLDPGFRAQRAVRRWGWLEVWKWVTGGLTHKDIFPSQSPPTSFCCLTTMDWALSPPPCPIAFLPLSWSQPTTDQNWEPKQASLLNWRCQVLCPIVRKYVRYLSTFSPPGANHSGHITWIVLSISLLLQDKTQAFIFSSKPFLEARLPYSHYPLQLNSPVYAPGALALYTIWLSFRVLLHLYTHGFLLQEDPLLASASPTLSSYPMVPSSHAEQPLGLERWPLPAAGAASASSPLLSHHCLLCFSHQCTFVSHSSPSLQCLEQYQWHLINVHRPILIIITVYIKHWEPRLLSTILITSTVFH